MPISLGWLEFLITPTFTSRELGWQARPTRPGLCYSGVLTLGFLRAIQVLSCLSCIPTSQALSHLFFRDNWETMLSGFMLMLKFTKPPFYRRPPSAFHGCINFLWDLMNFLAWCIPFLRDSEHTVTEISLSNSSLPSPVQWLSKATSVHNFLAKNPWEFLGLYLNHLLRWFTEINGVFLFSHCHCIQVPSLKGNGWEGTDRELLRN